MAPHPTLTSRQLDDIVAWVLAQKTAEAAPTAATAATLAPVETKLPVVALIAHADPEKIPRPRGPQFAVAPLTSLPGAPKIDAAKAELGRQLLFRFMQDRRLDGADPATLVRDMITAAHTMNLASRLLQERLMQVPEYLARGREGARFAATTSLTDRGFTPWWARF